MQNAPRRGRHGDLIAHKSEKSGKRFIRCTNYDDCGVSYPLPARGKLEATGEVCEHCGAPVVVVTARGPWRICVNMDCPGKGEEARPRQGGGEEGPWPRRPPRRRRLLRRLPAKKAATKKA